MGRTRGWFMTIGLVLLGAMGSAWAYDVPADGTVVTSGQTVQDVKITGAAGGTFTIQSGGTVQNTLNGPALEILGSAGTFSIANLGQILAQPAEGGSEAWGVRHYTDVEQTLTNQGSISTQASGASGQWRQAVGAALKYATASNSGSVEAVADRNRYGHAFGLGVWSGTVTNSGSVAVSASSNSREGYCLALAAWSGTVSNSGSVTSAANLNGRNAQAFGLMMGVNPLQDAAPSGELNGRTNTVTNSGVVTVSADENGRQGEATGVWSAWGVVTNTGALTVSASTNGVKGKATGILMDVNRFDSARPPGEADTLPVPAGNSVASSGAITVQANGNLGTEEENHAIAIKILSPGYETRGETGAPVQTQAPDAMAITNSGVLTAQANNNAGAGHAIGIRTQASENTIVNSGTISVQANCNNGGAVARGIDGDNGSNATIINSGTISVETSGNANGFKSEGILVRGQANITNTGTVTVKGGGTGIRTEGGADTIVQSGVVAVDQGANAVDGGGGTDTLNLTGSSVTNGNVVNIETINKNGGGAAIINGQVGNGEVPVQTFNVTDGTLNVNGNAYMGVNALTVAPGGVLVGTGTIFGNVSNSGKVAPGNSIGTLHVVGNYTNQATGVYEPEIQADGKCDVLAVTGTATLQGGRLQPILLPGAGVYQNGQHWDVLTTGGGVSGQFSEVAQPQSLFLKLDASYALADRVRLVLTRQSYSSAVLTYNQWATATNLDKMVAAPVGEWAGLLEKFDFLTSAAQFRQIVDQLHPELYDAGKDITFAVSHMYTSSLQRRLHEMRMGLPGFDLANLFDGQEAVSVAAAAPAVPGKELYDPARRTAVWAMGDWLRADQDSHTTRSGMRTGFDYTTWGAYVGMDRRIDNNFVLGFAAGFGLTDADFARRGSSLDVQSIVFGPYVSWFNGGYYADASIQVGLNEYDLKRTMQFLDVSTQASADYDGRHVALNLGTGYQFRRGAWVLGPTAQVQYIHLQTERFTETGAGFLNLRVKSRNVDSFQILPGFRVAHETGFSWGKLVPEVRLRYAHEFLNDDRNITSEFVTGGVGVFTVRGSEPSRNSALLGAALNAHIYRRFGAFANYDVEVGRKDSLSHRVNVGLRVKF